MAPTFPLPEEYGREILRCEVGSTLHGTGLPDQEDHDEMGIYLERPLGVFGSDHKPHWVFRTAGGDNPSTPTDTDVTSYSARRWTTLALKGNPSALLLLHAPPAALILCDPLGADLRAHAGWFSSLNSGAAFLGYMNHQWQKMTGLPPRAERVREMPAAAVNWKCAMHLLRLGHQGVEFLTTGTITLPVPGGLGDHLRSVRRGDVAFAEVVAEAEALEAAIRALVEGGSPLPASPDRDAAEAWLVSAHRSSWGW